MLGGDLQCQMRRGMGLTKRKVTTCNEAQETSVLTDDLEIDDGINVDIDIVSGNNGLTT